jgi:hypothetical protein
MPVASVDRMIKLHDTERKKIETSHPRLSQDRTSGCPSSDERAKARIEPLTRGKISK